MYIRRKKRKRHTPKHRAVYAYLISFSCFAVLALITLGLFLRVTVMNRNFVMNVVSDSEYTSLMTRQIRDKMVEWGANSGVTDETVFTDAVTEERVYNDTLSYFRNAMSGENILDTSDLERTLRKSVSDYAHSGDLSGIDESELEENINHLVELCVDGYRQRVAVGLIPEAGRFISRASIVVDIVFATGAAVLVMLTVLLFRQCQSRRRALRYLIYSVTAVDMLWWGGLLWVRLTRLISRVALTSRPLYTLATDILNAMMKRGVVVAAACTALLAALIVCRVAIIKGDRRR